MRFHAMCDFSEQMCTMTTEQQNELLGGDTALIKVQATKTFGMGAGQICQLTSTVERWWATTFVAMCHLCKVRANRMVRMEIRATYTADIDVTTL